MPYVRWFAELSRESTAAAGGKGANLAEMVRAGLPVPPGFVITVDAYNQFIQQAGLAERIEERLRGLSVAQGAGGAGDSSALVAASTEIQGWIEDASVPVDVGAAIQEAYVTLSSQAGAAGQAGEPTFVAVRSSATAEDAAAASFAGMFRSFLNVRGAPALLQSVRACWASLFTARSLAYRARQGVLGGQQIAVIVQQMVNAEKSGVLFTIDPATGNTNQIVIEAAWGLGELVVQGDVRPDRYVVDKRGLRILERVVNRKDFALTRSSSGENQRVPLDDAKANERVLADDEVRALAELAVRDETHYGAPQDAEWAIMGSHIFLVQTRPVTTVAPRALQEPAAQGEVLIRGLGASPGNATGPVRIVHAVAEGATLLKGEVLVAEMTSPDWVPLMRRAAAIVTDGGGMTSHAAIVSRELGLPCIVGTGRATRVLQDGQVVTIDGSGGTVRRGVVAGPIATMPAPAAPIAASGVVAPVTATRLYVNLGEPERAAEVARMPVDGVGLLRAEFMILSALDGTHPRQLLQEGRGDEFVARIGADLQRFAAAFAPRPVIYRTMDFRTNEFRGLRGGATYEPEEANPMIGYRGCFRYVREPDLFQLELRALRQVREQFDNLHVMIPFVRTRWEFALCKRAIDESGLIGTGDLELWVMAEVPSVAYWLPQYAALGATGVSIGSNDLTQLVLGVDRDSQVLAPLYDERDPAVLDAIHRIIDAAHGAGMTCSICGQAPSVYPDYAERLVRWGIDSISVTPDAVDRTHRNVAAAEQRLLLENARRTGTARPGRRSAGAAVPERMGHPFSMAPAAAPPAALASVTGDKGPQVMAVDGRTGEQTARPGQGRTIEP